VLEYAVREDAFVACCSTDGFTAWQFLAEIKAYRQELEQLEKELTNHTRNGNREKIAEARHVFLMFINISCRFCNRKVGFFFYSFVKKGTDALLLSTSNGA
jgi:hypothetical protein